MVVPVLTYASPCYRLSKYVTHEQETIQKRVVKLIFPGTLTYKEKIAQLQILPLPTYIQINDIFAAFKNQIRTIRQYASKCAHTIRVFSRCNVSAETA